jgi:hypothetical protein
LHAFTQVLEGLASRVVAQALDPCDASVALAHIQLLMVNEMAQQRQRIHRKHDERQERVSAKRQILMAFKKRRTTIQELNKLYNQVAHRSLHLGYLPHSTVTGTNAGVPGPQTLPLPAIARYLRSRNWWCT